MKTKLKCNTVALQEVTGERTGAAGRRFLSTDANRFCSAGEDGNRSVDQPTSEEQT